MLAILQLFGISEVTQLEDFCFFFLEMIGKCGNRNSIFLVGNFSWNMRTLVFFYFFFLCVVRDCDLLTSFLIFPFFFSKKLGLFWWSYMLYWNGFHQKSPGFLSCGYHRWRFNNSLDSHGWFQVLNFSFFVLEIIGNCTGSNSSVFIF